MKFTTKVPWFRTIHDLWILHKNLLKVQEIALKTIQNPKFSRGACPWTPLDFSRLYGARFITFGAPYKLVTKKARSTPARSFQSLFYS